MKQLLLLSIISLFTIELTAQACQPDEMYRDSSVGVYPAPYHPDTNPEGGITDTACINSGFEFVFTFKVPNTFNYNGFDIAIDSIVIQPNGAVGGLPVGLDYACNPGDCVFEPADTLGCMIIQGIATDANSPGIFPLTIQTKIYTAILDLDIQFPTDQIPGADGEYNLVLEEEGSMNCTIAGIGDFLTKNIRVSNSPNPFGSITSIEVNSAIEEVLHFRVFDILGNLVHHRMVEIYQGENNFEFDGAALSPGIYTYTLSNKAAVISKKMVISR